MNLMRVEYPLCQGSIVFSQFVRMLKMFSVEWTSLIASVSFVPGYDIYD